MGYETELYAVPESERKVIELAIVITDPPSGAPIPFTLLLNTHDHSASMNTIVQFVSLLYF